MNKNWRSIGLGLLFLALILAAYWPALHGDFIWDDEEQFSKNQAVRSADGLRAIWFQPGATMQYYPLTFSAWWVGYHLWGLNPLGYHLLTLLLHGCVAVLLWQALARLKVRGAWLAGAIFALHPVNVMSVAWMTELKNTLSASLALGAAWAYLRFALLGVYADAENGDGHGAPTTARTSDSDWRWYGLALGLFTLAMLAKTAVSFVPVSLLLITWWQRGRLGWRELWPVLPMVGLAALFGAVTIYVERLSGAAGEQFSLGFVDRVLVSGRSFWFYLGKLFYPYPLTFIYERWTVDARVGWQYLYPAATVALFAGLWWWRERIGRGVLVALLHFYVSTSLLILGVVLYMTQYSFVSDHWQYFGCMSVIVLTAAGITRALEVVFPSKLILQRALCGLLLLLLGSLTWRHARVFNNMEALWRDTLAKNPAAFLAHYNLGNALAAEGKMDEAIQHFEQVLLLKPESADAHNNLGTALARVGRSQEAIQHFELALQFKPSLAEAHDNLGHALADQGKFKEAIAHFQQALDLATAQRNAVLAEGASSRLRACQSAIPQPSTP